MTWIQTFTGKRVDLLNPEPESICIEDIAHALSLQARFNGHTIKFYSVAEHSLRVAELVPAQLQLTALLHDATEAYLGDCVRPLKQLSPEFREMEKRFEQVIADRFGLTWPFPAAVQSADRTMLATEATFLLGHPPLHDWAGHLASPLPEWPWFPMTSEAIECIFLGTFERLKQDPNPDVGEGGGLSRG